MDVPRLRGIDTNCECVLAGQRAEHCTAGGGPQICCCGFTLGICREERDGMRRQHEAVEVLQRELRELGSRTNDDLTEKVTTAVRKSSIPRQAPAGMNN